MKKKKYHPYGCLYCNKTFATMMGKVKHVQNKHASN